MGPIDIKPGSQFMGADRKTYTVKTWDQWNDNVEFEELPSDGVMKMADAMRTRGLVPLVVAEPEASSFSKRGRSKDTNGEA